MKLLSLKKLAKVVRKGVLQPETSLLVALLLSKNFCMKPWYTVKGGLLLVVLLLVIICIHSRQLVELLLLLACSDYESSLGGEKFYVVHFLYLLLNSL